MKTIRVYDINLSPETQPMDTQIGADYRRVFTILYTLRARGADAKYLNLHRDSLLFMDSPAVQQIMRTEGMEGFPCMTADDEIILTGRYPTNEEILEQLDADMLQLLANPAGAFAGSACNGVCSSCHVAGCGPQTSPAAAQ
ncbi:MAG: arsenic metallochaperone ArsD family protein [Eubacteriales bacterium]|nr:arsenic metallochaperone ArsD family protein [Eubacteriales bacterium]